MKNTIIKVLSVLMAMVFAFGSCVIAVAAEDAVEAPACEHANAEVYGKVDASCTTWGYTLYYCPDCGEYFTKDNINEFIPPHIQSNADVTKTRVPATCKEGAHTSSVCKICGTVQAKQYQGGVNTPDPSKHVWGEPTITENNCTDDGVSVRVCTLCGEEEETILDATGHAWVADEQRVTAPTCQTTGLMPYYCAVCDATKTVIILECECMYVEMPAIEGTCGVQGRNEGRYCVWCGEADPTDPEAGYPTLEQHDFQVVDGTYVAPDCENDGYYTGKCANCGTVIDVTAAEDEDLKALGHTWGDEPVYVKPATCTSNGYAFYGCTRSADEMRDGEPCDATHTEILEALGHDMQPVLKPDGTPDILEPTCTEPGGYKLACSRCPYTGADDDYEVIEPLGHDLVDVEAKAPTCTEPGNTAGKKCTRCDYDTSVEIPATNHEGTKQYFICTVAGLRDVYCTACGLALNEGEIVTLTPDATENHIMGAFDDNGNHVLGAFNTVVEPDCTNPGLEEQECKYCHKTFTKTIPALGHTEIVDEVKATCVAGGHYNVTCGTCGEILEEGTYDIDPDAHVSVVDTDPTATYAPTCTEPGQEKGECQLCGEKYTKVLEATGHTEVEIPETPATCTTPGLTAGVQCSVCDEWIVEQEPIEALGHDKNEYEQVDPTCTEVGYTAGWDCNTCGASEGRIEIPAKNHEIGGVSAYEDTTVDASCANGGRIGYTHHICTLCGDEYIDNYKYAPKHVWGEEQEQLVDCGQDGFKYKECSVCHEQDIYDVVESEGHKNAAGDVISTACDRGELTDEEITCVYCLEKIEVEHDYKFDREVLADCITYHHNIEVCSICGDENVVVLGTNDPDAHDWNVIYENDDPIVNNIKVKKQCSICGAEDVEKFDAYKVQFMTEVVNSSGADVKFVNGSHRTNNRLLVNIYIRGLEGTAINSAKFDFVYKTDALELADVIPADIIGKDELVYNNAGGTVKMLYAHSNVLDEATGNNVVGTLNLDSEKQLFVTLEFKIKDSFYGANDLFKTTNVGTFGEILLADAEHNEVIAKGAGESCETVEIWKRGELTHEAAALINNADLTAMLYLLANGKYDVQADLDLDGYVNSRDYLLMRDWIIEKITYPSNTK